MKLVHERYRVKYVLRQHGYACKHSRVKNDLEDLENFIIYLLNLDNYVSHEVVKEKIYEEPYRSIRRENK